MENENCRRGIYILSAIIAGLLIFGGLTLTGDTEVERDLAAARERLREAVASAAEAEAANQRLGEELGELQRELSTARERLSEAERTAEEYRRQIGEYETILAGYKEAVGENEEVLARVTARNEEAKRIVEQLQE